MVVKFHLFGLQGIWLKNTKERVWVKGIGKGWRGGGKREGGQGWWKVDIEKEWFTYW